MNEVVLGRCRPQLTLGALLMSFLVLGNRPSWSDGSSAAMIVELPEPRLQSEISVEEALSHRRSVRTFRSRPISLEDLGQVLWAAQGVTDRRGRRAAPSAGALYPLELLVVAGEVEELPPGIYRYRPRKHRLVGIEKGDARAALAQAALGQQWVREAPASVILAAVEKRTAAKYGARARRYVRIEVGAAAANLYLQATARGLGTVLVGAFRDDQVHRTLGLGPEESPLAIMPLGWPGGMIPGAGPRR